MHALALKCLYIVQFATRGIMKDNKYKIHQCEKHFQNHAFFSFRKKVDLHLLTPLV